MNNLQIQTNSDRPVKPPEEREIGAFEALWAFFSSMKTAIILLLILTAASIAGTVIEDKTGVSIYGSAWYTTLLSLVGLNLLICSINRFGIVWRRTFHPDVDVLPLGVAAMPRSETLETSDTLETATEKVRRALRSRAYGVFESGSTDKVSFYASKGRAALWGPHITHISLLVIFIGAVYGNYTGSDGYMNIVEGKRGERYEQQSSQKKIPLGFQVALNSFQIKYDKNHMPVGYKSDLQVFDNGQPMVRKVIDVNQPLSYKGMSFYQSSYGLVGLVMRVTAPDGTSARIPYNIGFEDTPEGRRYGISDQPFRTFKLGSKKLTLFVHNLVPDFVGGTEIGRSSLPLNPAVDVMVNDRFPEHKEMEAWTRLGWMTQQKPMDYKGYSVVLEKVYNYTGLQVSRNPGLPIVYLGFGLVVLGILLSFYITHRIVRVSIVRTEKGVSVVTGAISRADPSSFDKDFQRVREALTKGIA